MTARTRSLLASAAVVCALAAAAWQLPGLRRTLIFDLTYWDAPPGDPPALARGAPGDPGLARVPRTRVVLIDGLDAAVVPALAHWNATCRRGLAVGVDVGFPTVSLPVEVALWSGLTQQQTGVVHRGGGKDGKYGHPLDPPLHGTPSRVAGSIAIAEDHGWIARSLGFARVEPPAGAHPADDLDPPGWAKRWEAEARSAVASPAPLVFVHVLRVDTAGHKFGMGPSYGRIAVQADAILGRLVAEDPPGPGTRWFLLSDHGHLGTHGGEERSLRHVQACIVGGGVAARDDHPLIHVVDIARAIADSTGTTLDPASVARPLATALAAPLSDDLAVPGVPMGRGMLAMLALVLGLGTIAWGATRWWLAPWWFAIAIVTLLAVQGTPTLSSGWLYAWDGRAMLELWVPGLIVAAIATYLGLGKATLGRVVVAQLGAPVLALAAAISAAGAWATLFGAEVAPVVPRYSAHLLVLVLMVAAGAAAVALGVLARLARRAFDRRGPAEPPRTAP